MEAWMDLWTDTASLAIFDPAVFEASGPVTAWPYRDNSGVHDGRYALVALQGERLLTSFGQ